MLDMPVYDQICTFINEFGEDLDSLELLLYFARHHEARFNRAALVHGSGAKRLDANKSLRQLMKKGLVVTCIENGNTLYMLTRDVELRSVALKLLEIDQRQWQAIVEKLLQGYETA